jgi:replicative DNA helicase
MAAKGICGRDMADRRGKVYNGTAWYNFAPSRATVAEYARILDDRCLLEMATSDLFWDRVTHVIPSGQEDIFDLTVPGPESWLADGVVSHNSGALEQDSDVVVFLYREEVYNPKSEKDRGLAEVIVGKHRNGPIGNVTLVFAKEFTRFDNYTPRADF